MSSEIASVAPILYRIAVIGDRSVGKTGLMLRMCTGNYRGYVCVNTGPPDDNYRKELFVDDEECIVDALDTPGTDEFVKNADHGVADCEAFLLAYSVTSRSSLEGIAAHRDEVIRLKGTDKVPMVLIGCKSDSNAEQRVVSVAEGEEMARKLGMPFRETSALTGANVNEATNDIVREIRKLRPASKQAKCIVC